jgi:hypothetical protein
MWVQDGVTVGVWWAILIDVLGDWSGQDHALCWVPIIWGVIVMLVLAHLVVWWRPTSPAL